MDFPEKTSDGLRIPFTNREAFIAWLRNTATQMEDDFPEAASKLKAKKGPQK